LYGIALAISKCRPGSGAQVSPAQDVRLAALLEVRASPATPLNERDRRKENSLTRRSIGRCWCLKME